MNQNGKVYRTEDQSRESCIRAILVIWRRHIEFLAGICKQEGERKLPGAGKEPQKRIWYTVASAHQGPERVPAPTEQNGELRISGALGRG